MSKPRDSLNLQCPNIILTVNPICHTHFLIFFPASSIHPAAMASPQDHRSAAGRRSARRCERWPSSLSFAGDASARSKGAMPASPASISSCFAAAPLTFCSHRAVYPWRPRLRCFPGTNPNFCSSVGATDLYVDMDSGSSCMS